MRWIIIFFLFPLFSLAQTVNSNWLTPFATVDFREKEIVFRVAEISPACELIPVALLPGEFLLSREQSVPLKCAEIYQGIRQLGAYLENPDQPGRNYNDRLRYIKAFALQSFLALSNHGMPSTAVYDKVSNIAAVPDQEIARISGMTLQLYKHVENYLKEQYGRAEYLSSAMIPESELDLFSSDRLISTHAKKTQEQITDSIVWPKYYSKTNNDSYSDDITEMYDKGYLICGNYNGYYGSDFKQWSWLIKTDINGNILWDKIIEGGDQFIRTVALEPMQDGGILTCGLIWTNGGNSDPYVMKLNSCGEKEWCKIFIGSTWELPWAHDIRVLPSGEIIVLINQFEGNNAVDLIKLSSNGDLQWKKSYCKKSDYPDSDAPLGYKLTITSSGNYLISGQVYWENPWGPNYVVYMRSLFIMVSETGIEEWVLPFGLQDTLLGTSYDVIEINDGQFIGVGFYPEQVYYKGLIMNLDMFGNELNFSKIDAKLIDSSYNEVIFLGINKFEEEYCFGGGIGVESGGNPTMETIADTNLFNSPQFKYLRQYSDCTYPYVLGRTEDKILSNSTNESQNYWKIALSKLNLNLEYDTTNYGYLTYDSLCQPGPPQSGFIFLNDCDIITGTDIPSPEEYYSFIATIPITAYPNPAETEINLAFQNTEHHTKMQLECYNIYGQQVHTEKIWKGQKETRIDLHGWAKGLYFAVVKSEGKVAGTGRFVRK